MRRKVSVLLAAQSPDSHTKAPGQQQVSQGGTCDPTRENRTKVKRWGHTAAGLLWVNRDVQKAQGRPCRNGLVAIPPPSPAGTTRGKGALAHPTAQWDPKHKPHAPLPPIRLLK